MPSLEPPRPPGGQGTLARTRRRDGAGLFLLGLLVNSLAACWISAPGYMDAYYYFGGAQALARGQGFSEPYLWNYLAPRLPLAAHRWPSHLYWMPLVSLIAAPAVAAAEGLAGEPLPNQVLFRAAQIPLVVLAALLPLLSYAAAGLITGHRRHALAAALLTLFSAYYFVFWTTTDAFALYAIVASGALLAAGQAERRPRHTWQWLFVAGLGAGAAHLTRADGVLVFACLLVWWVTGRRAEGRWHGAWALAAGYGLVMAPWFARNMLVMGAPLAPGGARTLWLTHYDDFFTYAPERLTLANYLAAGWPVILAGKWRALVANLGTLVGVQANVVLLPFMLIGLWHWRRVPLLRLAVFYGLSLFSVMTLAFSFPGARGGYLHSGAAMLPFLLPAAMAGLDSAVEAAARRLRHWQPEKSKPIFTVLTVIVVSAMAVLLFQARVIGPDWRRPQWSQRDRVYAEVGAWLLAVDAPRAIVAVNNPPGWYYFTGLPSLVIPNGGVDTVLEAMASEQARWLVLDADRPTGLATLYAEPEAEPRLSLRATFVDQSGRPVFVMERIGAP